MTDREMLLMAYGALKATADNQKLREVVQLVEVHLYPPEELQYAPEYPNGEDDK